MDKGYLPLKETDCYEENKKSTLKKLSSKFQRYYVGPNYPGIYITPRELEIAVLLIQGNRYKVIGERLSISVRSVEERVRRLRVKFKCHHKKTLVVLLKDITIIQTRCEQVL